MIRVIKKFIFLIAAILVFVYIALCDMLMSFSLSMNTVFVTMGVLLLLLYYINAYPINKEERGPSFFHELIKVVSIFFFSGVIGLILFNVIYPKNYLNEKERDYDYIIVFGAGVSEDKNEIMNSRIEKAIEYSINHKRCKFVLTGAKGENEPIEEAVYMRNYMMKRGVNDSRIIVDPFSINTSENVVNSLKLIKKDAIKRNARENIITRPFKDNDDYFDLDFLNIGFMSSEFHLTRINMMAKKLGIRKPFDIDCETYFLYKPYLYVREDLSLFKALVLNQIRF